MDPPSIPFLEDTHRLLEDLLEFIVSRYGKDFVPVTISSEKVNLHQTFPVSNSIIYLCNGFKKAHDKHVSEILNYLVNTSEENVQNHVNRVGKIFFEKFGISWGHLRVFIAYIMQMATFAVMESILFLANDILVAAANFIFAELSSSVEMLGGWEQFELDCANVNYIKKYPDSLDSNKFYCSSMKKHSGKSKSKSLKGKARLHFLKKRNKSSFAPCKKDATGERNLLPSIQKISKDIFTDMPKPIGKRRKVEFITID